jgi:extracellular elastinolytic metalloproteinase
MWDINVDAENGKTWSRTTWTSRDNYRVFASNVASPNHTSPLPPADGRVLVTNPANPVASPFGWHDTNGAAGAESTLTQGNNVQAYTDVDANNTPDANSSPNGGANLVFDFPLNLTLAPSGYRPAAVTNLFYLNNIMHDVQYQYGFDEASGNFQMNNYGRGGVGNDSVRAEAQDGSGTNNANFSTPPDGSRPRMQMFTWTSPNPDRDGDLDATIVYHEYGHGISTRLVGGPSNSSCLGSA